MSARRRAVRKGYFAGAPDDDRPVRPEDVLRSQHMRDEDCDVDPETLLCRGCGVVHDPAGCEGCGGHGFHRVDDCPVARFGSGDDWR